MLFVLGTGFSDSLYTFSFGYVGVQQRDVHGDQRAFTLRNRESCNFLKLESHCGLKRVTHAVGVGNLTVRDSSVKESSVSFESFYVGRTCLDVGCSLLQGTSLVFLISWKILR